MTSYSANQIASLLEKGDDLTNWTLFDQMTETELETAIDEGEDIGPVNSETIKIGLPPAH